jgi:uncharacterized protein (DUF952 family)
MKLINYEHCLRRKAMKDLALIKHDIESLKQEIRYAAAAGDSDIDLLYSYLDELLKELYEAQTA